MCVLRLAVRHNNHLAVRLAVLLGVSMAFRGFFQSNISIELWRGGTRTREDSHFLDADSYFLDAGVAERWVVRTRPVITDYMRE